MKKLYIILVALLVGALTTIGAVSLLDEDQAVSLAENRKLAQQPELTAQALLSGGYTTEYETYYADQFPQRESLRTWNRALNQFYFFSGSQEQNALVIDFSGQPEGGGESIAAYEAAGLTETVSEPAQPAAQPTPTTPEPEQPEVPDEPFVLDLNAPPEPEPEEVPEPEEDPAEETPEVPAEPSEETPGETEKADELFQDGSILILGDRAMDVPYATYSLLDDYAAAVNQLAANMPGTRVFNILTPNAACFYAPESFRSGNYYQPDMFDYCYGKLKNVTGVDVYTPLSQHTDEYIYFRTDHHWTALGAYYAYEAFSKAAGFKATALKDFETGRYEGFVGSLYGYTSSYPQSQVLLDNPDYLDYYLSPSITSATCTYYYNSDLLWGQTLPVVSTKLSESVSNKYLCFVGGDFPLECIETETDGPVCIVLKESYGNAFVPFLTAHYSKIYLIDPREFNRGADFPSLNLPEFAARVEADDVIVLNYPFMINNQSYIRWLDHLVNTPVYETPAEEPEAETTEMTE